MPKSSSAVATPRAWRSPTIVLGPVSVAVGLKALAADEKIHAKTLCPCHTLPILQVNTCRETGEVVEPIKRYEVGDTYVELDTSVLEAESDYTLSLEAAPGEGEIDTAYFGKPYLIWPKAGYESQYDMLAAAIAASGRALVGTVVLTKTTEVLAVKWSEQLGVLIAQTVTYGENINMAEVELVREAQDARPAADKKYVAVLRKLIEVSLPDSYDPDAYTNDYRDRVRDALQAAANGQPIPQQVALAAPAPATDLMAALEASVALAVAKKAPAAKGATKKPAAKKPATAKSTRKKTAA